jgi:CheY-like chemotaxis protein
LQEIVDRVVTGNIQQAEKKGLQLNHSSHNYVVYTDPVLLERVVENFVANAIRYTEKGRIDIDCQRHDQTVCISVSDTGIGIPADELEKVFEEYYQLDNPVRDLRKGLGLGLSIVRLIARLLGHRLNATSTLGRGSTFSVEVPFVARAAAQPSGPELARQAHDGRPGIVVLLVDDDPAIIDATAMLLKLTGFVVHSALSGQEALAHVTNGIQPDVVVTDYRLPGLNGVEVLRQLRELTGKNLPAVIMTGDTSPDETGLAQLANCSVLHKPVDTDKLVALLGSATLDPEAHEGP